MLRFTAIRRKLGPDRRHRLQGVGLAAPLALSSWQSLLGVTPEAAERWNRLDLREAVADMCDWPVHAMKDTAAACVAELVEGRGRGMHSFLYIFVDTFIGGGLVIDSHLRNGLTGNAGAIGSMPLGLPDRRGAGAAAAQRRLAAHAGTGLARRGPGRPGLRRPRGAAVAVARRHARVAGRRGGRPSRTRSRAPSACSTSTA